MRIEYDPKADTVYVKLREGAEVYGEDIDSNRGIDYDAEDRPVGVEFLNVSGGVDVDDLPEQQELARLLAARHIRVLN
jgi:uncharacterized protein YuzE